MKLFLKISLAIFSLFLIVIVGFALVFDPNDYKDDIITLVKNKSGRELSIPGDISLSLFPWVGLELGKVEIGNAKGFTDKAFAKIDHLQVRVKLWPLLQKKLEADTLVIEGLLLNLAKNKQGVTNWDDLNQLASQSSDQKPAATQDKKESEAKSEAKADPESKPKSKPKSKKEPPSAAVLAAFAINGLEIKQSELNWHDQQLRKKISIKDFNLALGELKAKTRIPFETQFRFQQKDLDAKINLSSQISFSENFKLFSFYDTALTTDLKLATLKKVLSPELNSAEINLDLNKQTFLSKNISLSAAGINLQSQLSAQKILSSPEFRSTVSVKPFNLLKVTESLGIKLPELADPKALNKISSQLVIHGSLKKVNLSNLELTLDDTRLKGNAAVNLNTFASKLKLNINDINLDRYSPKPVKAEKQSTSTRTTGTHKTNTTEVALVPVTLLSQLDVDANLNINKLQIKNTHWSKLKIKARANNGLILIKPLDVSGYGSNIQGEVKLQLKKDRPFVSADLKIKNLKSGLLLNDFMKMDKLKGIASIEATINSNGIKLSQLKQNLNGLFSLSLKDGSIKGYDLEHQGKVLEAKLKKRPVPPTPSPLKTDFANVSATGIIKNGVITNNDLRAETPFTRVIGRGTIDIAKEKLNYVTSVKFTSSAKIKDSEVYEKMETIPLEINISGTFSEPKIQPDFGKVLEQIAKKEIQKEVNKVKEKAQEDIKKKVGDELKKLFKF